MVGLCCYFYFVQSAHLFYSAVVAIYDVIMVDPGTIRAFGKKKAAFLRNKGCTWTETCRNPWVKHDSFRSCRVSAKNRRKLCILYAWHRETCIYCFVYFQCLLCPRAYNCFNIANRSYESVNSLHRIPIKVYIFWKKHLFVHDVSLTSVQLDDFRRSYDRNKNISIPTVVPGKFFTFLLSLFLLSISSC